MLLLLKGDAGGGLVRGGDAQVEAGADEGVGYEGHRVSLGKSGQPIIRNARTDVSEHLLCVSEDPVSKCWIALHF